jgi:hypothetical protein
MVLAPQYKQSPAFASLFGDIFCMLLLVPLQASVLIHSPRSQFALMGCVMHQPGYHLLAPTSVQ